MNVSHLQPFFSKKLVIYYNKKSNTHFQFFQNVDAVVVAVVAAVDVVAVVVIIFSYLLQKKSLAGRETEPGWKKLLQNVN